MRSMQEMACDAAVLEALDASQRLEYGNTLLRFAERNALETFPAAASLINSKSQMKRRILFSEDIPHRTSGTSDEITSK